jgi:hypothetical protein
MVFQDFPAQWRRPSTIRDFTCASFLIPWKGPTGPTGSFNMGLQSTRDPKNQGNRSVKSHLSLMEIRVPRNIEWHRLSTISTTPRLCDKYFVRGTSVKRELPRLVICSKPSKNQLHIYHYYLLHVYLAVHKMYRLIIEDSRYLITGCLNEKQDPLCPDPRHDCGVWGNDSGSGSPPSINTGVS